MEHSPQRIAFHLLHLSSQRDIVIYKHGITKEGALLMGGSEKESSLGTTLRNVLILPLLCVREIVILFQKRGHVAVECFSIGAT